MKIQQRYVVNCALNLLYSVAHLSITRMLNRDQYRKSIRGVSGLAVEESKMHTFSRI